MIKIVTILLFLFFYQKRLFIWAIFIALNIIATIIFKRGDSFENEVVYASLLLEEIEKQGYEIVGDYLCETINDMILFDDYKRNMYLRLQIPIKL